MKKLTDLEYLKLNKFQALLYNLKCFFCAIPSWFKKLGLGIWQFCNAKSYLSSATRINGYNDKGLLDEYRRPKLAWDTVTRCISASKLYNKHKG